MKDKTLNRQLGKIRNNKLQILWYQERKINDEQLKLICDALKHNTSVHTLHLAKNQITDQGMLELIALLKVNKTIKTIKVGNNLVKTSQLYAILKAALNANANETSTGFAWDSKTASEAFSFDFDDEPQVEAQEDAYDEQYYDEQEEQESELKLQSDIPWYEQVQKLLGYQFKNGQLLHRARIVNDNMDLEAWGDAIFDVVFDLYHGLEKQELATNDYLSNTKLANILKNDLMELQSTGRTLQGNAVEAVLGAVFLDSNMNHKLVEQAALNIVQRYKAGIIFLKAKPEGLGCSLRKLACMQIVLQQKAKDSFGYHYVSTIEKDKLIHLLATHDKKLTQELVEIFKASYDYQKVIVHVQKSLTKVLAALEAQAATKVHQQTHHQPITYGYDAKMQTLAAQARAASEDRKHASERQSLPGGNDQANRAGATSSSSWCSIM